MTDTQNKKSSLLYSLCSVFKYASYAVAGPIAANIKSTYFGTTHNSFLRYTGSSLLCAAFWGTALHEFDPNFEQRRERIVALAEKTPCVPAATPIMNTALGKSCEPIPMPEYSSPIFRMKTPAWDVHVTHGTPFTNSQGKSCVLRWAHITTPHASANVLVYASHQLEDLCFSSSPK